MTVEYVETRLTPQIKRLKEVQSRHRREGWHPSEGELVAVEALKTACALLGYKL